MVENQSYPLILCEGKCGYFDDRETLSHTMSFSLMRHLAEKRNEALPDENKLFSYLMKLGFRRDGNILYKDACENCKECTPIRLRPENFIMSKSQKKVWNNNQDIEVTVTGILGTGKNPGNEAFVSEEKAFMLREYDFYHNGNRPDYIKLSIEESSFMLEKMNSGYSGVLNMEYSLDGKLIAVGILDYGLDANNHIECLSSNYFYYDTSDEILKRSIGVFSVLKEIEFCNRFNIPYYYLGLYLPNCRKMNYKIKYKPYELLENNEWIEHKE